MDSTEFEYPGMTSECHPECFNTAAMPAQPKEKKPGQLPDHLVKQFFEEVRHKKIYSQIVHYLYMYVLYE